MLLLGREATEGTAPPQGEVPAGGKSFFAPRVSQPQHYQQPFAVGTAWAPRTCGSISSLLPRDPGGTIAPPPPAPKTKCPDLAKHRPPTPPRHGAKRLDQPLNHHALIRAFKTTTLVVKVTDVWPS